MTQRRRTTGRRVAILSGLALLVPAALALHHWRDIATEYHFLRIERDPSNFLKAAEAEEGSPAREAAIRYLSREGSFLRILEALPGDNRQPSARKK